MIPVIKSIDVTLRLERGEASGPMLEADQIANVLRGCYGGIFKVAVIDWKFNEEVK